MSLVQWLEAKNSRDLLTEAQKASAEFIKAKGFPQKREPTWKFSGLKTILESDYVAANAAAGLTHDQMKAIAAHLSSDFHNVVIVNGEFNKTLSNAEGASFRFEFKPAAGAESLDAFDALNGVAAASELNVFVSSTVAKPVHFCFVALKDQSGAQIFSPRLKVHVGDGVSVHLVESHFDLDGGMKFVNAYTRCQLGKGAQADYVMLEGLTGESHFIGRTRFDLGAQSRLRTLTCANGGAYGRHRLDIPLNQEGAAIECLGVSLLQGTETFENYTHIDHVIGGCDSQQTYKSILAGESRSVFSGQINIRPQSQKANSNQLNQNLLLSEKAEAITQPQLMIEADDVKATHGATIGQLSEDEMFYLLSRGINRKTAVAMLAEAFTVEIFDRVEAPVLRQWLRGQTQTRLQALSLGLGTSSAGGLA